VLLVVPVKIAWKSDGGHASHQVETEVVNAHGALLRMKAAPPSLSSVQLTHTKTGKSVHARVLNVTPPRDDGYMRMAVELAVPSYDFWGVVIPPATRTDEAMGESAKEEHTSDRKKS